MAAGIVAKGILCPVESATRKVRFVAGDSESRRLPPLHSGQWRRCRILPSTSTVYQLQNINKKKKKENPQIAYKMIVIITVIFLNPQNLKLGTQIYSILKIRSSNISNCIKLIV